MMRRLAFQPSHYERYRRLRRHHDHHMYMVIVKANRLYAHAGHTSQQLRQHLFEILDEARLQDPPPVLRYPNYMVLKLPNAVRTLSNLHGFIVQTAGSFIHG